MGAWFSKNWWVVLILGLVAVGVWWYLSKEENTILTPKDPCKGHEAAITEWIDKINADADWKKKCEDQTQEAEHPCHKKGLTKEECIRLNAVFVLKEKGLIRASCSSFM